MATIREIQASFIAKASGMKSTIQGVKKEIGDLAKDTKKMSDGMDKNFSKGTSGISKSLKDLSLAAQKNFESIGNAIQTTSSKLESWGNDIKDFGKKTSKALSPLTLFYTTAAITGGRRMAANEQLDILMRNVFRTEEAYKAAWDAVNGLTKGTAFMNADVGQWLSQLVQSNVELEKSEDVMKSILDFSVGSGQLGIEGEIHDIIMKAVRAGGWDQMTLDMLAQRGLNLAGHVANVLGITTESAQEMLKDGTISMADSLDYFVDAVQVGSEGAGGYFAGMANSAQAGGETFTGALVNMGAAVAQLGERMWKSGAWDTLKEAMNNIYDFLQELAPALDPVSKIISDVLATMVDWIQKLMTAFINLRPKTQALIAGLSVLGAVLGPAIFMFGSFVGAVGKALKPLGTFFLGISKGLKFISGKSGLTGILKTLAGRFSFLIGPVGIAIGIITTLISVFTIAYKRSETFRNFVHDLGEKIKDVFLGIIDWIRPGFDAMKDFFSEIKDRIVSFKNDEGAQLIQAFQNIGSFISDASDKIWKAIEWTFEQIKWIIADYVMPVVEFIIKQVWGNIKGIITGALDVIMGAVKVFSGLFTGDFSKMWEGVKEMFFGAIKVIWNWIQLQFIGRILKGIGGLASGFWGHIKNLWKWVTDTFKNSISTVYNGVRESFVGRIVRAIIDFAKNFRKNISDLWDTVKKNFTTKISEIRTAVEDSFVGRMIRSVTRLKDDFINLAGDMWTGVKKRFDDIVEGAKALPGRIGDGIKSMASKVKDGIGTVVNTMADILEGGVNGVIDGINWVLDKLGVSSSSQINHVSIPRYAKGTKGHPEDGPAILNDGKGDNAGQELIINPDGSAHMYEGKNVLAFLRKGTQVISAKNTRKMLDSIPAYADGEGWINKAWDKTKSGVSKAKDFVVDGAKKVGEWAGNVWDYATNPSKLLDVALDWLGVNVPSGVGFVADMAKGAFNTVKDKAIDFVKEKLNLFTSSAPGAGSGVQRWAGVATNALRMTGQYTKANLDRLLYQMQTESGGNPRAINLWDINAKRGTPSKGLMQVIDPTFRAYRMPGFNNIWNPLDNILASIRYAVSRYGNLANAYRGVGYADGGIVNMKQLAWIAEGGWAESIISHDPSKRVRQQRIWQETGDRLGFTSDKSNKEILTELRRIAKAVEDGKNPVVVMNDRVVGRMIEPHVTKRQEDKKAILKGFSGGD